MSHTTKINTIKIQDVRAMEAAVQDLKASGVNCSLTPNARPRMYYRAQEVQCDYVLQLHDGQYDVGFQKEADGSYAPIFDKHANYVGSKIGARCAMPSTEEGQALHCIGQFMQNYSKHAAMNAARDKGYMVEGAVTDENGKVQITITGY